MTDIAVIVVDFVLRIAAFFFLARFVLQLVRADFYNPICQGVVTITDPLLRPLRTVIKPIGSFDPGAFGIAWALHALLIWSLTKLASAAVSVTALQIAALALLQTLLLLTQIFFWSIIIVAIASWFVQGGFHPVLALLRQVIEPITAPVRRIMPDLGGIDLSPMVVLLGLLVLQEMLKIAFASLPL